MNRGSGSIPYIIAKKCEHPGKSTLWNSMNFFFCQVMVRYGIHIYKKVEAEFPDKQLFLIPTKDAGDFVHFSYFKNYMLDHLHIKEDKMMLICAESSMPSCRALNLSAVYPMPMSKLSALSMAYHYYGREKMKLTNAYVMCLFDYGNMQNESIKPCLPKFAFKRENVLLALSDIGCAAGKTVVLAPYEQAITAEKEQIPVSVFWEELAEGLKSEGFDVCTNCAGPPKEPPVRGTKRIFPLLQECEGLVETAGTAIVLRSGFADFAAMTQGKFIVLYPSKNYMDRYKLWNSRDLKSHYDIVYEGAIETKEYRKELIEKIIGMVKHE